jgi:hypothetical protein
MIIKPKQAVESVYQVHNAFYLGNNLTGQHKYMGVILGKSPYSHQTMQDTGHFMPVHQAHFTYAQGSSR